jgi:hypothetical protein
MDMRADRAEREAHVWGEFERALERIPRARWAEPELLADWSVKEMLWHVAGWLDQCAGHIRKMREGAFVDYEETDEEIDEQNAAFAVQARAMRSEDIWKGLVAARELVRSRWHELPEITDIAVEWFAGETYLHYNEHLPDLESVGPPPG